jgi:carbon monoxide dehydrogenase subunit G
MQMAGEQRIAASRQRVWDALNDPDILKLCIPGCESLEKESADRFKATIAIKIGPIGARFEGAVTLSDLEPPNGYTITGKGQGGTVGFAEGGAKVRLSDDQGGTLLHYDVDARVGGRLAQLGGPIIDATAKQLAAKFFRQFGEVLGAPAGVEVQPPGAKPTAAVAAAPAQRGLPVAWILAMAVAALTGFLVGRGDGGTGSDWMGLSIGLLVVIVAAASFAIGRSSASPVILLDRELLTRLLDGAKR